ncbi:MAG TPA: protein-glutamate O-methyltransferase CheR [Xanthobacteraceae bacterium]|nr:protein-glutamate O-methyltransferase CheR [Xanthobacteraceae bacterium]
MTTADFDYLRRLLKERSGLVLSADKRYLLESRLLPIARRIGARTLGGLAQKLRAPGTEGLAVEVVEAMTTNETFFFRDKLPFTHLRDTIIPDLVRTRAAQRRIRIWCAAASSGQEPYSVAMLLKEMTALLSGWRVELLATDLSAEMLERAKSGLYSQFEVQRGLPIQYLLRYFTQVGDMWQIVPELRAAVEFRQLNLLHPFAFLEPFDVVFCRNVLIYFDQPTKADVLSRLARVVRPDGYLLLGAAETVVGLTEAFRPHAEKRGLYLRQADGQPRHSRLVPVASAEAS